MSAFYDQDMEFLQFYAVKESFRDRITKTKINRKQYKINWAVILLQSIIRAAFP